MRVVVTGGAGFVGSNLCLALLARGDEVTCVDSLVTGSPAHVGRLAAAGAQLIDHDVREPLYIDGDVDAVVHLANPASPVAHDELGMVTIESCAFGTREVLEFATRKGARFLLSSTSEVYGDPQVHPQPETYRGNVDPVSPRSVYDESKRFAETLTVAYERWHALDVRIVRLFNVYGPGFRLNDGRVVPNFVVAALRGEPIVLYGGGGQMRSFCYVDDIVDGVLAVLDGPVRGPVNLGNPHEVTMRHLAEVVLAATGSRSELIPGPAPVDDPQRRCPDVSLAKRELGWEPRTSLEDGIERTVAWFADQLLATG